MILYDFSKESEYFQVFAAAYKLAVNKDTDSYQKLKAAYEKEYACDFAKLLLQAADESPAAAKTDIAFIFTGIRDVLKSFAALEGDSFSAKAEYLSRLYEALGTLESCRPSPLLKSMGTAVFKMAAGCFGEREFILLTLTASGKSVPVEVNSKLVRDLFEIASKERLAFHRAVEVYAGLYELYTFALPAEDTHKYWDDLIERCEVFIRQINLKTATALVLAIYDHCENLVRAEKEAVRV